MGIDAGGSGSWLEEAPAKVAGDEISHGRISTCEFMLMSFITIHICTFTPLSDFLKSINTN